jgi:hypothetical protein
MEFAERKEGGIVEEQGGFRPGRGTEDQLFVLTETLRMRTGRTTYAAFIDVKKAYDTVWRNGLWKRLWDEGIRGKMWRVVRGMYTTVESAVLVGEEKTEWFELHTGVRQGCVMSPVLFSLFINGLAREVKEKGMGVKMGERRVTLLLYADDIVLLSETPADLQRMMDVVSEYSRKWRFSINPKKGKSEVLIFGRKSRHQRKWMLAGKEVGETTTYKYLGVELQSGLRFRKHKERIVAGARRRMMQAWGMGMRHGELPVRHCIKVWETMVRPILEYSSVVWGHVKWEEAEAVQREMGRMILRCSPKMTNEVVLGELGWWTLKARRDMLRLNFWAKITGMSDSRLVKQVYAHSRHLYEVGQATNWCKWTHQIMAGLGLQEEWGTDSLSPRERASWKCKVRAAVQEKEEAEWQQRMEGKPKLRTYARLKSRLIREPYLLLGDRRARQIFTRLRGGTNELRIETGRYAITSAPRTPRKAMPHLLEWASGRRAPLLAGVFCV